MAKKKTGRRRATGSFEDASDSQSGFSPRSGGWKRAEAEQKKATGKSKKVSGRMKSGRRSTGKVRAVRARPAGHMLIPVVCSECFEDLAFDTSVATESLTCPICEHSSARPDDGTLNRIHSLRASERTNFMIAFIIAVVSVVSFLGWAALMLNPANQHDNGLFWGPLGLSLLCALVLMVFTFKYEGNRWEVYF